MADRNDGNRAATGWSLPSSPYHAGEKAVQARDGVSDLADRAGRRMIRDYMPDQHRTFFEALPLVFLGALDRDGKPWASVLTGPTGFMTSPDPKHLRIRALPVTADPARDGVHVGAPVALIGVEFHTRRRNRMTGKVVSVDGTGFDVRVDQSFGNCPQYIQARNPRFRAVQEALEVAILGADLNEETLRQIGEADTLFIASASLDAAGPNPVEGVDVSHRGGRPGFVKVEQGATGTVLTFPDFNGNRYFNTFGNIAVNPQVGLLFPDFLNGTGLSLSGRAEILWDDPAIETFDGAVRMVRFGVEQGRVLPGLIPFTWSEPEPSPQTARTGRWEAVS
ncbi:MAG: pyridoxamine 5'-phosphate oxidase family protein [Alphaproteobacteria bacterium]|nr:pyridoxamine 5'-phosphate oxidase family protein [Alphaproteobacteria bacterium]